MKLAYKTTSDLLGRSRFSVILVNPQNQENIGLVARAMSNTGFSQLRIAGLEKFDRKPSARQFIRLTSSEKLPSFPIWLKP